MQRALRVVTEELGETPAALFVRFEQGVQLAGFLGKGEPPRELERWVEEQVLQASNDDVTQTDFSDGGEEPDTPLVQGTRHRVFLLTTFDSDRQITVGALTIGERHDARHFVPQPALQALSRWLQRDLSNPLTTGSLHSRPLTQD